MASASVTKAQTREEDDRHVVIITERAKFKVLNFYVSGTLAGRQAQEWVVQSVMATCGSEEGEISAAAQLSAMFPDLEWEVSLLSFARAVP